MYSPVGVGRRRIKEPGRRRPWRRLAVLSLLISFLGVSATYVLGRLLLQAIDPLDLVETVGAFRGNEYEDTSILVFEGSEEDAESALRGGGSASRRGAGADNDTARAARRSTGVGDDGSSGGSAGVKGASVRVYFEPTPQLVDFLDAIDKLDRDATLRKIGEFIAENGDALNAEDLAIPIQNFHDLLAGGKSLPQAVVETMQAHGLAGKQAVERVVAVKRDEYDAKLDKYVRLSVEHGVHKEDKILRYQQKLDMVKRVEDELNKSFRVE